MTFNIDWTYAGAVVISGLVVVFAVLLLLWGIVAFLGRFLGGIRGRGGPKAPPAPVQAAAPPAPMPVVEDGIGEEVVAVIAAAVAAMSGSGQFVLRSVRRSREARPVWMAAGLEQNTRPF